MDSRLLAASIPEFAIGLGVGLFVKERMSDGVVGAESGTVSHGEIAFNAFISDWNALRFIETDRIGLAKKNLRISLEGNLVNALKHGKPTLDLHEPDSKTTLVRSYLEYWHATEKVNYGEPDPINSVLENAYLEYVQGDE